MTWLLCLLALIAAAVVVAWALRTARRMDDEARAHVSRMDQWETHRRERFRRAMEDRQ